MALLLEGSFKLTQELHSLIMFH